MSNPVGRPRGSTSTPNPLKSALKASIPAKIPHKKAPQEFFQGTKHLTMKMDAISHATLEIQARRRHVPLSWLIQDILNLWLAASTDYRQGVFVDMLPPNARAARCPERYSGYIDSLGFAPANTTQAPNPQPQIIPAELPPAPPQFNPEAATQVAEPSVNDLLTPYQHPFTKGPASYPHPEPTLPQGARVFNPDEHQHKPGMGSAAQEVQQGRTPQDGLPPLAEDVEALLRHYHVRPEDIR